MSASTLTNEADILAALEKLDAKIAVISSACAEIVTSRKEANP